MQRTINLAASGQWVENVKGKVFAILAASAAVDIEFDRGGKQTLRAGGKIILGKQFKRVLIIDTSGAPNEVTFYAGNEDIYIAAPISADGGATNATIVAAAATPNQFLRTSATPGTPIPFAAASTLFQRAKVIAQKTLAGAANVGNVKIGPSATVNQQPFVLAPGDEITLEAPIGKTWNFTSWYMDVANSGDGIVVIYS